MQEGTLQCAAETSKRPCLPFSGLVQIIQAEDLIIRNHFDLRSSEHDDKTPGYI